MATLFSNWHFMRVLRAAVAVWAIFSFFKTSDPMMLVFAALFGLQAVFDIGCCGSQGCAAPRSNVSEAKQEAEFEEVK